MPLPQSKLCNTRGDDVTLADDWVLFRSSNTKSRFVSQSLRSCITRPHHYHQYYVQALLRSPYVFHIRVGFPVRFMRCRACAGGVMWMRIADTCTHERQRTWWSSHRQRKSQLKHRHPFGIYSLETGIFIFFWPTPFGMAKNNGCGFDKFELMISCFYTTSIRNCST